MRALTFQPPEGLSCRHPTALWRQACNQNPNPGLAWTIPSLVIIVFSLLPLHDVSRIVNGGETNYVMAATGVHLILFNIFASLLHLLMVLSGERD